MSEQTPATIRTLRFHEYGEPAEVLRLEQAPIPSPAANRVRLRVQACSLNPADWALCGGLFPDKLPRGVGLDVAGVVDAVGEGVSDVRVGDAAFGRADYAGCETAGAGDYAILDHWAPMPPGLDPIDAAALPMVVETAYRSLAWLDVQPGQTVVVNGAGAMVGFAGVQIAMLMGARVIAVAGETFADKLRALGAIVVARGDGLAERVREAAGGTPDLIFDAAPVNMLRHKGGVASQLPQLIEIVGGDARRVMTCVDFENAAKLGARMGFGEAGTGPGGEVMRWDVLDQFGKLAAEGRFTIPIARTFPLEDWREALDISLGGHAHGKLVLLPGDA